MAEVTKIVKILPRGKGARGGPMSPFDAEGAVMVHMALRSHIVDRDNDSWIAEVGWCGSDGVFRPWPWFLNLNVWWACPNEKRPWGRSRTWWRNYISSLPWELFGDLQDYLRSVTGEWSICDFFLLDLTTDRWTDARIIKMIARLWKQSKYFWLLWPSWVTKTYKLSNELNSACTYRVAPAIYL